jgi:ABC-type antimicrobial peptide transport system permease subunit
MKPIDVLRIAMSTFTNNRMRTFLTIFGVSIGVATIVFLVSLGYGLQQITIGDIQSIKALTTYSVTTGNSGILALNQDTLKHLKTIEHVASVNGLLSMSGQITIDGHKTDVLLNDASAEYVDLESPKLSSGSAYQNDTDKKIIVTEVVATAFGVKPESLVGKTASLLFYVPNPNDSKNPIEQSGDYQIAGVIKDTTASYLYLPNGTLKLPDNTNFNDVKVRVDNADNMSGVNDTLIKMGYKTSSIGDKVSQMNKIFRIAQIVLLVFGAIALLVASIGMFNTLTISLLERTKDIGIMKALGAKDKTIYSIFLAESTIISFAGGLLGIIIALILGVAVNVLISTLALRAGGDPLNIFQPPYPFIAAVFAFSVLVGVITGVYPARRAAKLDPLVALRYE